MNRTELLPDRPGITPMAKLPEAEVIDVDSLRRGLASGSIDLICVLGPTASGKTRYAVQLAHALGESEISPRASLGRDDREGASLGRDDKGPGALHAEIISADSRQVYRGMDIGTGKDLGEYGSVPYHLIDIVPAGAKYNIYEYQRDFLAAYSDIRSRGAVPILCGGSGLYIEAATCGYQLMPVEPDPALRASLEALSHEELIRRVRALNPGIPDGVLQSKKRTIRALEVALAGTQVQNGGSVHLSDAKSPVQVQNGGSVHLSDGLPVNTYYIGTLVSREERVERIDRRLHERLEEGLVEEVRALLNSGISADDLIYYGLEYKFVTQYVLGQLSYDDMETALSNAIHQFAKRQMTWFRGMERDGIRIHWTRV
jgi:tRNA dimethylallyltransferase